MIVTTTPQTLVRDYHFVWYADPALDPEVGIDPKEKRPDETPFDLAYRAFLDHGGIDEHLGPYIRSGERPSVFTLKHLRGRARRWLMDRGWRPDGKASSEGVYLAASLSLVDVDNMSVNGEPLKVRRVIVAEIEQVAEEQMELLSGIERGALVAAIGLYALTNAMEGPRPFTKG
jgi:hypothetical protein